VLRTGTPEELAKVWRYVGPTMNRAANTSNALGLTIALGIVSAGLIAAFK
jgi:hypothetical protein